MSTKNIWGKTRKFSIYMLTLLLLAGCDDTAKHKGIPKSVFHIKQKDIESQAFTNASEQSIVYIVDKFEKDGELVYDSHQPEDKRIVNQKIWDGCKIEWGLRKKGTSKIYTCDKEQVTEENKAEFTLSKTMPSGFPVEELNLQKISGIEISAQLILPDGTSIVNDKTDENLLPDEIAQKLIGETLKAESKKGDDVDKGQKSKTQTETSSSKGSGVEATDKGDDKGQKGRMGTTGESSATSTTTVTEEGESEVLEEAETEGTVAKEITTTITTTEVESTETATVPSVSSKLAQYENTLKSKFKETFSKYYEKENQVLSLGTKAEEQGDDVLYALSFDSIDSSQVNKFKHLFLKTILWKSKANGMFQKIKSTQSNFYISLGKQDPEKLVLRVKDIDKIDGLKSFFTDKTYRVEKIDNKVTFTSTKGGKKLSAFIAPQSRPVTVNDLQGKRFCNNDLIKGTEEDANDKIHRFLKFPPNMNRKEGKDAQWQYERTHNNKNYKVHQDMEWKFNPENGLLEIITMKAFIFIKINNQNDKRHRIKEDENLNWMKNYEQFELSGYLKWSETEKGKLVLEAEGPLPKTCQDPMSFWFYKDFGTHEFKDKVILEESKSK